MWRDGAQNCNACDTCPDLIDKFGCCGGPAPGTHAVLVGPPVAFCPSSGARFAEVLHLAGMVPSSSGPGSLDGTPAAMLPPRYRDVVVAARGWLDAYRRKG